MDIDVQTVISAYRERLTTANEQAIIAEARAATLQRELDTLRDQSVTELAEAES